MCLIYSLLNQVIIYDAGTHSRICQLNLGFGSALFYCTVLIFLF